MPFSLIQYAASEEYWKYWLSALHERAGYTAELPLYEIGAPGMESWHSTYNTILCKTFNGKFGLHTTVGMPPILTQYAPSIVSPKRD